MTERERLIELIQKSVNGCARNWAETIADYLLANGVKCMPFIAMIERTTEKGEFCKKKSEQKFNGRYCLVYEDKEKWGTPLIDICGTREYNAEEAEKALDDMKGGAY